MTISTIKQQLTITQVLDHYGLQPNKNKMLCCPFHADKKPSMQVYTETNTVHCFSGNCEHTGKAIDQIDFILHKDKCTKHEAIKKAKSLLGIAEEPKHQATKTSAKQEDLTTIFKKLQQALPRSKKAVEYLESRNLWDAKLEIGYKPQGGSQLIKGMNGCVIFPLKNKNGEIVSFYGRSIASTGKHFYTTNRKGLYPNYPSQESREARQLIITESVIDAATINKHTNYQALALYGTNGLTAEHNEALSQSKDLKEIIFFLDGDQAGGTATAKYAKQLTELLPNVIISQVSTPEGEDPNSLTQSHEPAILTHLISERTVLFSSSPDSYRDEAEKTDTPLTSKPVQTQEPKAKLDTSNSEYLVFTKPPLQISVLGGIGLHPIDKLRTTLKIERTDSRNPLHNLRHSLDLYHDDQVEKLTRKSSERLELGSREVQITIAELIQSLEDYRTLQIEEQTPKRLEKRFIPLEREKQAINLMQRKHYLKDLYKLIQQSGVVGEQNNSLVLWITYATRKRHDPLHVICLGASGTGKTYLQEKISDLVPDEDKVSGTAISENALYYAQDINLKNKLFIIEDLDGASNILYALRELQTKKVITKMVTQKDSKGNLKTEIVTVYGPICLTATTTKERLYEDNANRCLLIYLDGSKEQQEAIMNDQRRRSAGRINKKEQEQTKELLRDMQALYRPITIRNPFAEQLKIPETVFKPLRTNSHYLAFIEGITFCNQFQRSTYKDEETGEEYINTEIEDIELANELMKEVLLSKSDELTSGCRRFFERLKDWLKTNEKSSFYSQDIRTPFRMSPNNVKYYLSILTKYGLIKIIGGHPRKGGHEYEIMNAHEYEKLQNELTNALDEALKQLKLGSG